MFLGFLTKKDKKQLQRSMYALNNLIIAMARIQKIHHEVLRNEALKTTENTKYVQNLEGKVNEKD